MRRSEYWHERQDGPRLQTELRRRWYPNLWKGAFTPSYAQDNVWKRLRLKAKQTRHHSPAAAAVPRKENWRKPRTSLMIPITGSTVHLRDRKSTRLNSSHTVISYAVFCLKKKKIQGIRHRLTGRQARQS